MAFGMKSCREVTQLVSQGLDRELAARERLAVRMHFVICTGCRRVEAQMSFLRRAVRALGDEAQA